MGEDERLSSTKWSEADDQHSAMCDSWDTPPDVQTAVQHQGHQRATEGIVLDDQPAAVRGAAVCGRRVPKRGIVLVMGLLMELICYADRTNISLAIIPMAREHGYSESVKGVIMASFFAGYCGTQILGGA